ncbi:hypothetical protein [Streptomyces sp. NPDC058955]|uniref:hypothetical protein n=1 Tax=unclassified Streptomyces TaxID=2593676 RepID=UPI00364868B9
MRASIHSCIARRVRPIAPTAGPVAAALSVPAANAAQFDTFRTTTDTLAVIAGSSGMPLIPGGMA